MNQLQQLEQSLANALAALATSTANVVAATAVVAVDRTTEVGNEAAYNNAVAGGDNGTIKSAALALVNSAAQLQRDGVTLSAAETNETQAAQNVTYAAQMLASYLGTH